MKRFIIELLHPGIHRRAEMLPEQVEKKLLYKREKEKLENEVAELKIFITNMEARLKEETSDVKKKAIVTSKAGRKLWLEVKRSEDFYFLLHIQVYDLWRKKYHWVGEFFANVYSMRVNSEPYLFLSNFQVSHQYQNQGIGQIIFQEAFDWLKDKEPEIAEIRGRIAKGDDDANHDRLAYLYQKLGATINWYPEEKIVSADVAEFRIPLSGSEEQSKKPSMHCASPDSANDDASSTKLTSCPTGTH